MQKENNDYHSIPAKKLLGRLKSSVGGLSSEDANARLAHYGKNEIQEEKSKNPIFTFLKQFHSFLIYILIIAALISWFVEHYIDVYVICAIILFNATIGFIQEHRAEKAIKSLKNIIVQYAKVYRNGQLIKISAKEIVPGDIVLLEEGDKIPADARILGCKNFRTVESSLTGESLPKDKFAKDIPEKTPLADRLNMTWMGTFVASGTAKAIIVSTGERTVIGQLAKSLEQIREPPTIFRKKTSLLAKQMAIIAASGSLLIFIVGFFIRGIEFTEIFLFTIAALVSAIPEGLPAVLTIVLAIGAHRMSKRNAVIRNLPATATLALVNIILTDKTGTLTQNTMTVQKIVFPEEKEILVSGEGWIPRGEFSQDGKVFEAQDKLQLSKLLKISVISNNSRALRKSDSKKEQYEIIGDPTEAALAVVGKKAGIEKESLIKSENVLDDIPFSPEVKYRASLVNTSKTGKQIYVVGAPEVILKKSKYLIIKNTKKILNDSYRNDIHKSIISLAKDAYRTVAVAYKNVPENTFDISEKDTDDLIFVGIVGMSDPIRPEVKEAISKAEKAGMRVMMLTGDHKITALSVAKQIGLITKSNSKYPEVMDEEDIADLPHEKFLDCIRNVSVFSRLTPKMKLKIATALQKDGNLIAMTGDGVNDALALKKADIGVAMGIIGTDVARESSEIILSDDNFASIINAVEEGRIVFTNTKQTSFYLVTTSFAEQATIIATLLINLPLPLLPTQILWLNLVTDGMAVIPLASERGHTDVLNQHPLSRKEGILTKDIMPFLILNVSLMLLMTLITFMYYLPSGIEQARAGAFTVMAFTQLFNALNMRSIKTSIFKLGLFTNKLLLLGITISALLQIIVIYNPFISSVFKFAAIPPIDFVLLIAFSSLILWAGEAYKLIKNRKNP
ncbi:cation-transporting ATPase [Candidatus Pacearchaeota archaeon CG10_big_fil_rev_8_21_14_0_10_34_76]|nr:MAG: cation-transporting ATPase [Candidatus Pacearchaeota archaeon CG10_big_fil_rev_8_21_14_0_10_34_76]